MATTTWNANKDVAVARRASDLASLGAGAMDYLPVGLYSGYLYRSYIGFSHSFAGMTSITNAVLKLRTSSQVKVAFGSRRNVLVQRVTAPSGWPEGTATSLSGSNATEWDNQPTRVSTNEASPTITASENTWVSINITGIIQDAFAAGILYGIGIRAVDEASSQDVTEFYAREYGSYDAYIEVTYTTEGPPDAPIPQPSIADYLLDTTPDLTFQHNDDDGHATNQYQVQVSTSSTFGTTVFDSGNVVAVVASGADFTVTCTTTLTRGTQYYTRARASDTGSGYGPWSAAEPFKIAQFPVATLTEPSATGRLGKLTYTGGSGWASPRLNVGWSFSCPDGGTQTHYEVEVYNDSAGSPGSSLYDSGSVAGAGTSLVVPATLTEGNYYHVRVQVKCSHGETSAFTSYFRIRTRWGVVAHRKDLGSAPTSWSITTLNTTITPFLSSVTVEYGSDTAANATPASGYLATLAEAPLRRYFYYRVWLLSWGASPATSPSLDKLVLSYSAVALVPDKWTREDTTNSVIDVSTFVYGTQSLKMNGKGSAHRVYQLVNVVPNTDYILSGRMKSLGDSGAQLVIAQFATSGSLAASTDLAATADWARYATPVWNSGANTQVYIWAYVDGASGTTAGWFDAVKLEASSVVTPWTPSFLADAVVLDAGGLQVDASMGGIFRLRGSTGGSRDLIDLVGNGLRFGGATNGEEISSPAENTLKLGDGFLRMGGTAFPASPTTNDVFYRTDFDMWFFYDGTRWLSCQSFTVELNAEAALPIAATTADWHRSGFPYHGGTPLWLEKLDCTFYVGGGTALSGSHKWEANLRMGDIGAGTTTTLSSTAVSIASGSSDQYRRAASLTIDSLRDPDSFATLTMTWTKTGTPGGLYAWPVLTYRLSTT